MRNNSGSALIFVLWIVAILIILFSEIAFKAKLCSFIYNDEANKLQYYPTILSCLMTGVKIVQSEPELNKLSGTSYSFDLKEKMFSCELEFSDEAGKYNINSVDEKQLLNILESIGINGEKKDIIVDSILDWRDANDFHRLNGAEKDYYQSLDTPYKCKNGNFDSIDELILVKGIDLETFTKLKEIFTIYPVTGKININSASKYVLKTLKLDDNIIDAIISARKEEPFIDLTDLQERVSDLDINSIKDKITFQDSGYFKVIVKVKFGSKVIEDYFDLKLTKTECKILNVS